MILKQISFSQSRETVNEYGLKRWNKFGVEIECSDTDDTQKAKDYAVSIVESWHNSLSQTENEMKGTVVTQVQEKKSNKDEQIEGFKQAIAMTTNVAALEKLFKKLADNTSELKDAYETQYRKLFTPTPKP